MPVLGTDEIRQEGGTAVSEKLRPGVVTGKDYEKLVQACKAGNYALPAVNVTSSSTVNAVLEAAARNKSDVIIQVSNGGAAFFGGPAYPDGMKGKVLGAVSLARHVHLMAEGYGVCVVLHTDHANRGLLPWIDGLLEEGAKFRKETGKPLYTSHMIDLSEEPIEENIETCAIYMEKMAPLDMSLEIELGVTGGEEDGVGTEHTGADNPKLYTQPEDVALAYKRLSPLGHFSIAASFGNVHGVYKPGNVKLRPVILKDSQTLASQRFALAENALDLVFHGGSGSSAEEIREAVSYGVFKMNVDTDLQYAYSEPVGAYVNANQNAFKAQIDPETGKPLKSAYDPRKWMRQAEKGLGEKLDEIFAVLGSNGKTLAS
ncbi:class II fructose-bisphosphate aldolase [Kiloniella laminariae]|uniref:Fructose-bisphosphate aldolase n=1 Tax=Kiloniella laminariae TaxID=454162 RepID=A0ABT4LM03_9PROT|nr:class II fructose-bisphosphate aldolase [Kiloniella laminariae]MCZ4282104.1 class II fructose-bisphosphate aldolase [Kiloniella laminariae]